MCGIIFGMSENYYSNLEIQQLIYMEQALWKILTKCFLMFDAQKGYFRKINDRERSNTLNPVKYENIVSQLHNKPLLQHMKGT